jgi:predicted GH43/DUF377 family glycosyl hydrolase
MWAGPVQYLHPENEVKLITENIFGMVSLDNLELPGSPVHMQPSEPQWDFVGLEDARIVRYKDHFGLLGVRRDHKTTGEGRMELSTIERHPEDFNYYEVNRLTLQTDTCGYCEKNWMPVIDDNLSIIRWIDPMECYALDDSGNLHKKTISSSRLYPKYELRGSSQVIPVNGGYLALVHSTNLWLPTTGGKNCAYRFHFAQFDKDLNLLNVTRPFSLLGSDIEFSCGMCTYKDKLLITFSEQDSNALLFEADLDWILNTIGNELDERV